MVPICEHELSSSQTPIWVTGESGKMEETGMRTGFTYTGALASFRNSLTCGHEEFKNIQISVSVEINPPHTRSHTRSHVHMLNQGSNL